MEGLKPGDVLEVPLKGKIREWVNEHWKNKVNRFQESGEVDDEMVSSENVSNGLPENKEQLD